MDNNSHPNNQSPFFFIFQSSVQQIVETVYEDE